MTVSSFSDRTPTQDRRRARELFQYVLASDILPGGSPTAEPDAPNITSGLASLCELVAFRCNARRAVLNVMDKDTMYTLSDASNNADGSEADIVEDPIIRACSAAVPLEGRVCEMTIKLATTVDTAPTFIVNDLSQSMFKYLDVVAGPPYFRFYAGTPIITRNGVTIGSLALLDPRPRDGLTPIQEKYLTRVAAQMMLQLEINRRAIEGMKSTQLARSLEYFIAGKSCFPPEEYKSNMQDRGAHHLPETHPNESKTFSLRTNERTLSYGLSPVTDRDVRANDLREHAKNGHADVTIDLDLNGRSHILARAANLIREGFGDLGEGGSVVIVSRQNWLLTNRSNTRRVEIVAASTASRPFLPNQNPPKLLLEEGILSGLIERYPEGRIFALDEPFGSRDPDLENTFPKNEFQQCQLTELNALKNAFPHANQTLFSPLWNSDVDAYVHAVFLTNSAAHSLSSSIDLPFLKSFCDSVAAECARVEALKADKQKSDFVGTISHEMRSPLHGILASAEFLTDTILTDHQRSLIDAVQSCGRTLLDTIDHVLDYSKINTSRKNWQADNDRPHMLETEKQHVAQENVPKPTLPALLQLTSVVDIGVVLEEVVDNLVLGQNFTSTIDITDLRRSTRGRGPDRRCSLPKDDVSVLIDVQKADWIFTTQPGALRRIVLNLVGNAFKYTAKGYIKVQLQLTGSEEKVEDVMILTVTDTGRGIGRKFLDTLIYVPFAQENALAPGTGLGLSIVHNIVTMLGGQINIQSEVGKGTTAKVIVPLRRPLRGQPSSNSTPPSDGTAFSQVSLPDDSILWLQSQSPARQVMIFRPEDSGDELEAVLNKYLGQWYQLDRTDQINDANMAITEEKDLDALTQTLANIHPRKINFITLILCSVTSRHDASYTSDIEKSIQGVIEWISMPIGPHKLAKSIKSAIERSITIHDQSIDNSELDSTANEPKSLMQIPTPDRDQMNGTHEIADELNELILNEGSNHEQSQVVQASENMSVSHTSQNAQKAIHSPEIGKYERLICASNAVPDDSYPFPMQNPDMTRSNGNVEQPIDTPKHSASSPASTAKIDAVVLPELNSRFRTTKPRILVVDDNKINSSLLRTFLTKKRKYTQVDCAENGQEAVELFTRTRGSHEIIFMDISMPIMDGFEATRAIREFEKDNFERGANGTMIVALTGLSSNRDQAKGFEAGMDIYLTKPVSLKAVGQLLDNWELHRQMSKRQTRIDDSENLGVHVRPRVISGAVTGTV